MVGNGIEKERIPHVYIQHGDTKLWHEAEPKDLVILIGQLLDRVDQPFMAVQIENCKIDLVRLKINHPASISTISSGDMNYIIQNAWPRKEPKL